MSVSSNSFKSKTFIRNVVIAIVLACISIAVIYNTMVGYVAMSAIAISSIINGLLEPRRGWVLAIIYSGIIVLFWLIKPIKPASQDLAMFSSYLSIFVSLGFGFIIGVLGRMFE
jgi:hypothetical protein